MRVHRFNNAFDYLGVNLRRHHGCGAISAHAAGVRTLIIVVGPLVVLTGGQRAVGRSVHDHQHAGFLSGKESLQQDVAVGFDRELDEGSRLVSVARHDHALSACQHVALDHPGLASKRVQRGLDVACFVQPKECSRRYARRLHGLFGVEFGAFEMGQCSHRTKASDASFSACIRQAIAQRCFRSNYHQIRC